MTMRAMASGAVTKWVFTVLVGAVVGTTMTGCSFLDDLEDDGGNIDVFTAHHGTPTMEGEFPALGEPGMARRFHNDQGWEISLGEAYVTTAGVDLASCSGSLVKRVDLFWGPSAENVVDVAHTEPKGIGGVRTEPARFCQLQIRYGPYSFGEVNYDGADHAPPQNDSMEGQTVLLRGFATKDDVTVDFEFVTDMRLNVVRDISTVREGKPLQVERDQGFPVKIVLTKTYDRFFDGIDFADYSDDEIEAAVAAALELDSGVIYDVNVTPDAAATN